ncbi:hypothetical protein DXV76_16055 [Rhodobacteraceae bacterium CCMM004]|nr:hypothetical protein DXV76_16055 [Rhodobacteraceae bacterium CCMM004]
MTQILFRNDTDDPEAWHRVYGATGQGRADMEAAGMTIVQTWTAADAPGTLWVLVDVDDPADARDFMATDTGARHSADARITTGAVHWLEPM